jgi:hypothetical protein
MDGDGETWNSLDRLDGLCSADMRLGSAPPINSPRTAATATEFGQKSEKTKMLGNMHCDGAVTSG